MAFHHYRTIFLLTFLLVANLHLFPRSTKATALDDICPLAQDRTYCFHGFGSDPRTKSADMHLLARVAIDKAQAGGTAIMTSIQTLERVTVNPELKALEIQCGSSYDDALRSLGKALVDLNQEQFYALRIDARRAYHGAMRCDALLRGRFKKRVTVDKKHFKVLCDIIDVIADRLASGEQRIWA